MTGIAQVVGPNGEVWKVAPDETWFLRGEPWPDVGVLVEVCWAYYKGEGTYEYGRLRLVKEFWDGSYNMSEWNNEDGLSMAFNPDFWRHIKD